MSPKMSDDVAQKLKAFTEGLDQDSLPPCGYCKAPWFVISLDPDHKDDCPMVTSVYPVLKEDLQGDGFVCEMCDKPFVLGDSYKAVLQAGSDDAYAAVCIPCLSN